MNKNYLFSALFMVSLFAGCNRSQIISTLESEPSQEHVLIKIRNEYFNTLDYTIPVVASKIPELDKKMILESEKLTELASKGRILDRTDALFLAYTAMFIKNTNEAVERGAIALQEIVNPIASASENKIADREQHRLHLLDKALEISKNEALFLGWRAGALVTLERAKTKKVSNETLDTLVRTAELSPFFNTAAILINTQDLELNEEQTARTLKLVEASLATDFINQRPNKPTDDIFLPSETNTRYSPFNIQSLMTLSADFFVKAGEKLKSSSNSLEQQTGVGFLYKAKGLYSMFNSDGDMFYTQFWSGKEQLVQRQKRIDGAIGNESMGEYLRSREAMSVHSCASCHVAR